MAGRGIGIIFGAVPVRATRRLQGRIEAAEARYVVAADGGAATALAFGLVPDLVIGDFDSLDPGVLIELKERGVKLEALNTDKDDTDGALAVERAVEQQPAALLLLGFLGGPRLDHLLANLLLVSYLKVPATLLDERNECHVLRHGEALSWGAEPGELISLLPLRGSAGGVCTRGMRWPLENAQLVAGETRGVSNEPVEQVVSVSLRKGRLLVTRHFPDAGY